MKTTATTQSVARPMDESCECSTVIITFFICYQYIWSFLGQFLCPPLSLSLAHTHAHTHYCSFYQHKHLHSLSVSFYTKIFISLHTVVSLLKYQTHFTHSLCSYANTDYTHTYTHSSFYFPDEMKMHLFPHF